MEDQNKKIVKLTEKELPELKENDPSPQQMYCRFYKETWTGWEQTACSGNYGTEDSCASAAHSAGADAYSWTGNSC